MNRTTSVLHLREALFDLHPSSNLDILGHKKSMAKDHLNFMISYIRRYQQEAEA